MPLIYELKARRQFVKFVDMKAKGNSKAKPTKAEMELKKRLAYTLYVENGFDQRVIAELTHISENTISKWKQLNDWDSDRAEARMGFDKQRRRLRKQLNTILDAIEARKAPNNVPDSKEADTISKIADAAKKLTMEIPFADKSSVGQDFIIWAQEMYGHKKAVELVEIWHQYLMNKN